MMQYHMTGHCRGGRKNPIVKHDKEIHGGEKQVYSMVTVARQQALISLMMREVLLIKGQHNETSMIGKNDIYRGSLIRIQAMRQEVT